MDRYLKPIDVWALGFGCIVGWGAFVMPGTTFLPIAGPVGSVAALAACAAIMLVVGRNYAYLMAHRPGTGGVYAYVKEAFGRDHAFICSWFLTLSYLSIVFLNATAIFVLARTLFGDALQVGWRYQVAGYDVYLSEIAVSAAVLAAAGALFVLRKPLMQKLQTALAVVLIAGTAVMAVACLPHLQPQVLLELPQGGPGALAGALTIVLLAPWAFVGFDVVSLETAHFDFPVGRPWAPIALAIVAGGAVYIALTVVSISYLPQGFSSWNGYLAALDDLPGLAAAPAFFAVQQALGQPGVVLIAVTALAAILTGIFGASRGTVRMLSTMAEDRILSKEFLGTTFSILFIMVISIAISFLGRHALEWFVELTSFGATVAFGYASAAACKMAAREGDGAARAMGMAGAVVSAVFAAVQLVSQVGPVETMGAPSFLLLALWCLLGFAFYWRTMRQSDLSDFSGASASSTVLYCLLFYAALMWFMKSLLQASAGLPLQHIVLRDGVVLMLFAIAGLAVMLYVQGMLRRRHEELRRQIVRVEEGGKAKSQFLFNMSHDIRTPLNAIMGYTRMAKQEPGVPPAARADIEKIEVAGQSLLTLIDDILETSVIESGGMKLEPRRMDISRALEATHDIFDVQMGQKDIDFRVSVGNIRDRYVLCDENGLNRILLNLLSNACKFTPEGGTVTVALWQVDGDDPERRCYELRVRDSGIGMSADFAARVFDAFERERTSTDSGLQGTGLGLAITKGIVDLMGGSIRVETAPGRGTEFIVRLELELAPEGGGENGCDADAADAADVADAADEPQEAGGRAAAEPWRGMRVLAAEDNAINREILLMLLQQNGVRADVAENGRQAVDMLEAAGPGAYDAVLMDIQMPVMDGYAATRTIRALPDAGLAGIPVIAVTANAFDEDVRRAREAGMDTHVAKPIDPAKLLAALADARKTAPR